MNGLRDSTASSKSMLSSLTMRSLLHPLSPTRVGITTDTEPPPKQPNTTTATNQQSKSNEHSIFYFNNPLSSFFQVVEDNNPIAVQPDLRKQQQTPAAVAAAAKTEPQQPLHVSLSRQETARQAAIVEIAAAEDPLLGEGVVELILPSLAVDAYSGEDEVIMGNNDAVEIQIMLTARKEEQIIASQRDDEESYASDEILPQSSPFPSSSQTASSIQQSSSSSIPRSQEDCNDNDDPSYYTSQGSLNLSMANVPSNPVDEIARDTSNNQDEEDLSDFRALQAMIFQYEHGSINDEKEKEETELQSEEVSREQPATETTVNSKNKTNETTPVLLEQGVDQGLNGISTVTATIKESGQYARKSEHDSPAMGGEAELTSLPSSDASSPMSEKNANKREQSMSHQYEHGNTDIQLLEDASPHISFDSVSVVGSRSSPLQQDSKEEEYLALQAMIAMYENEQSNEGEEVAESNIDLQKATSSDILLPAVSLAVEEEPVGPPNAISATNIRGTVSEQDHLEEESAASFQGEECCDYFDTDTASQDDNAEFLALQSMIANYEEGQDQPGRADPETTLDFKAVKAGFYPAKPMHVAIEDEVEACTVATAMESPTVGEADMPFPIECIQRVPSDAYSCASKAPVNNEEEEGIAALQEMIKKYEEESQNMSGGQLSENAVRSPESTEQGQHMNGRSELLSGDLVNEAMETQMPNLLVGDIPVEYFSSSKSSAEDIEKEVATHSVAGNPEETSMSSGDTLDCNNSMVEVPTLTINERKVVLIRELKHIQLRGSDMFASIEENIVSWQKEEVQRQSQLSLDSWSKSSKSLQGAKMDQLTETIEEIPDSSEARVVNGTTRPTLVKAKSQYLIRELEFVQTQGDDIFHSINDKVKTWQEKESVRQLQVDAARAASNDGDNHLSKEQLQRTTSDRTSEDLVVALDENCKSRQNTIPTSELTESTHPCNSNCSATSSSSNNQASAVNTQDSMACDEVSMDQFEWEAPAHIPALVDTVLEDFNDTITVEVTVYSAADSLASDEEEWTVMDSLDAQPEVYEFFDFDDLEIEDDEEEYGVVGHGVSDDLSVFSELTTPSVASPHMERLLLSPKNLRKVPIPPRRTHQRYRLPFQQVKLRRAKTNPSRLSQMRQAALLVLFPNQLKTFGAPDGHAPQNCPPTSPLRSVRRCLSDKPIREAFLDVKADHSNSQDTNLPSKPPTKKVDPQDCLLDLSWDELDALENAEMRNEGTSSKPAPLSAPPPPSGTKQIGKNDSFYDSVSVSFLAPAIRDQTIVQVMNEALRILHTGGILNILDMNGAVIERIQQLAKYRALSFQKATSVDQQRVETNTSTILKQSGLSTKFHVTDPRIVHWTAMKSEASLE